MQRKSRPKTEKLRISLRIVFYREAEFWIAHCLEMDVMGHDTEKKGAIKNLCEAMALQIGASLVANNRRNIFMPADARFFEMFAAGQDVAEAECNLEIARRIPTKDNVTIDEVETREYRGALAVA